MPGTLVPQVTLYQQRNRGLPVNSNAGSSVQPGVPLLPDQLNGARLVVLAGFGADPRDLTGGSWVFQDITADIIQNDDGTSAINISTVGRPDEFSTATPAAMDLYLKNGAVFPGIPNLGAGAYSAHNPLSPNWPNLKQNVPIWIRVFVSGQYYTRFFGYSKAWEPGFDQTGNYATVHLSATGVTDRLGQGNTPLASALNRYNQQQALVDYWPLDDGQDATSARAATGDVPLFPAGNVVFGNLSDLPGAAAAISVDSTARLVSSSPGISLYTFTGTTVISGWFDMTQTDTDSTVIQTVLLPLTGGNLARVDFTAVGLDASLPTLKPGWQVTVEDAPGTTFMDLDSGNPAAGSGIALNPFDGGWHNVYVVYTESGGTITGKLYVDGVLADTQTMASHSIGKVQSVLFGQAQTDLPFGDTSPYQATAFMISNSPTMATAAAAAAQYQAGIGYAGETPVARAQRLCTENSVPFTLLGSGAATGRLMGPQTVNTLLALLRECELNDVAYMYDGGLAPGLAPGIIWQPIGVRYNQPDAMTLNALTGDLVPPFQPKDDDYGRRNLVVVDRQNGSSATYEDDTGPLGTQEIGVYDSTLAAPLNAFDDSGLLDRAAWEVHEGTIQGFRYASISLNFARRPALILSWLAALPGSSASITPPFTPVMPVATIRAVFEGWSEVISSKWWTAEVNCSRGEGYDIAQDGSATKGRLQGKSSTLVGPLGPGDTSCQVATSAGPVWTQAVGDLASPIFLDLDGIKVSATNVTGASSPQTFTLDGSTVTRAVAAGTAVKVWQPGVVSI